MRYNKNKELTRNKTSPNRELSDIFVTAVMLVFVLLILYPFVIMLMVSLKDTKEALINPNSIPKVLHWENYAKAWISMDYPRVFGNTLYITVISLAGIILFSGLCSYIIAWSTRKKFYNFIYLMFISGILIPFYTALVPLTKLMTDLHLNNSISGMILYYIGRNMPMSVFLYTGFARSVPVEILESSKIEGANIWQVYWKIMFPIMKPITSTILVLDALNIWNDYLFPKIMLTSKNLRTVTLAQAYFRGENAGMMNLTFAAYILTVIPVIIFYFTFQKYIIKGVAAGAVKG